MECVDEYVDAGMMCDGRIFELWRRFGMKKTAYCMI